MKELDRFYELEAEPQRSCFLSLRAWILTYHQDITEEYKYRLPFFYFRNRPFCYLWKEKTSKTPYIGVTKGNLVDHPLLIKGERKKMKIIYIDPYIDIPVDSIREIFDSLIPLYASE
jgi:hypothetical protein